MVLYLKMDQNVWCQRDFSEPVIGKKDRKLPRFGSKIKEKSEIEFRLKREK